MILLALGLFLNANANCPNAFTHQNQELCADLVWQKTDIQKGESKMSPYLNIGRPLPFKTHFSRVWLQIWKKGENKILFPEGLTVKPFMLMQNGHNHSGYSENSYGEMGIQLSKLNFEKMKGCWTISLQAKNLHHLIKIENYTNLNLKDNFEQTKLCGGHEDHSAH